MTYSPYRRPAWPRESFAFAFAALMTMFAVASIAYEHLPRAHAHATTAFVLVGLLIGGYGNIIAKHEGNSTMDRLFTFGAIAAAGVVVAFSIGYFIMETAGDDPTSGLLYQLTWDILGPYTGLTVAGLLLGGAVSGLIMLAVNMPRPRYMRRLVTYTIVAALTTGLAALIAWPLLSDLRTIILVGVVALGFGLTGYANILLAWRSYDSVQRERMLQYGLGGYVILVGCLMFVLVFVLNEPIAAALSQFGIVGGIAIFLGTKLSMPFSQGLENSRVRWRMLTGAAMRY